MSADKCSGPRTALLWVSLPTLACVLEYTHTRHCLLAGYSTVIPGFPRFSVLGDRNHGVYNLKISNVSIDDDAEFQCQVGPAKQHSAIRASAKLTVIGKLTVHKESSQNYS